MCLPCVHRPATVGVISSDLLLTITSSSRESATGLSSSDPERSSESANSFWAGDIEVIDARLFASCWLTPAFGSSWKFS